MARSTRAPSFDAKLEAVRRARRSPHGESSVRDLRLALADKSWLVVSEAAAVVGEHGLDGFKEALMAIWPRFVENAAKTDPGCRAKEAALTALDQLEILDPDPFLAAVRYRQLEPVAGGRVDTAGGVRVRALSALLRQLYPDAALFAGELMADDDPQVRAGVARALGYYGERAAGALLVHKLRSGDAEPNVLAECAVSLLAVAGEFGLGLVRSLLDSDDEVMSEAAALALGQSRDPAAIAALIAWVEQVVLERDIELGVRALGLSRIESARTYLLGLVREGSLVRARAAIEALAVHHYDEQLMARVRQAAAENRGVRLGRVIERVLRARGES
jgi:HEAT repeat protein